MKDTLLLGTLCLIVSTLLTAPLEAEAAAGACDSTLHTSTQTVETCFWDTFHNAKYGQIEAARAFLTKAIAQAKAEKGSAAWFTLATRLGYRGWLDLWQVSEGQKGPQTPVHLKQSMDDFTAAFAQLPNSLKKEQKVMPAILAGFQAATTQAYGHATRSDPLIQKGNRQMAQALTDYPWFNAGTQIATTVGRPHQPAVDVTDIWGIVTMCAEIDEGFATLKNAYSEYLTIQEIEPFEKLPDLETIKSSVCLNPMVAPHNYEATFLLLGDLMYSECVQPGNKAQVCNGHDWTTADVKKLWEYGKWDLYSYQHWPYRTALDQRIAGTTEKAIKAAMTKYPTACTTCHQKSID